jgi:hypothetical protein
MWFSAGGLCGVTVVLIISSTSLLTIFTQSLPQTTCSHSKWTLYKLTLIYIYTVFSYLISVTNHHELLMNPIWTLWVNSLMCDTIYSRSMDKGEGTVYDDVIWELSVYSQSDNPYKTTAGCSVRRRPIEEDPHSDRCMRIKSNFKTLNREWNRLDEVCHVRVGWLTGWLVSNQTCTLGCYTLVSACLCEGYRGNETDIQ